MAEIIESPPHGATLEQVTKKVQQLCNLVNKLVANVPDDSTASNTAEMVVDFNALLAVLSALNGR